MYLNIYDVLKLYTSSTGDTIIESEEQRKCREIFKIRYLYATH